MTHGGVTAGIGVSLASVCTLQSPAVNGLEVGVGLGAAGGFGVMGCGVIRQ